MTVAYTLLVERGEGSCAVVGALTLEAVPQLWWQLKAGGLLAASREADLADVTDVDSAGLALLVAWRGSCVANGGNLDFRALPESVLALAQLTGVESVLGAAVAPPASAPASGSTIK